MAVLPFRDLVATGHACTLGPSRLARAFPTWFDTSAFAADLRRAQERRRGSSPPPLRLGLAGARS